MTRIWTWVLVITALGLSAWAASKNDLGKEHASVDAAAWRGNRVIILVIDGVRYADAFADTDDYMPRIRNDLAPKGTWFESFRNEGLTLTNPGHASILTGTWQTIANDGSERPDRPTIFEYYRKTRGVPQERTYLIAGKGKLRALAYSTHPDHGAEFGAEALAGSLGDDALYEAVTNVLKEDRPTLVMVNLSSVDAAGHSGSWDRYVQALGTADGLTWELWRFIQTDPFYKDKTYLFVTNDHGRHDDENGGFKNHGCGCEGCRHIMLLALGPDIKAGHRVEGSYTQRDLCSTAGRLLGVAVPLAEGVVIRDMFTGNAR